MKWFQQQAGLKVVRAEMAQVYRWYTQVYTVRVSVVLICGCTQQCFNLGQLYMRKHVASTNALVRAIDCKHVVKGKG